MTRERRGRATGQLLRAARHPVVRRLRRVVGRRPVAGPFRAAHPPRRVCRLRGAVRAAVRAVVLLGAASVVVFAATAALPADAIAVRSGGRVADAELAALRAAAGLDRPAPLRYLHWLGGLLTGDPGRSLVTGRPVADLVAERAGVTAALVLGALAVALPLAAVLAAAVGLRGRGGRAAGALVVGTAALPPAVVGIGLAALASASGVLPPVSLLPAGAPAWTRPDLLVLPVLTLAVPTAAYAAGQLAGAVRDTVARPFVRDAAVRGVPVVAVAVRYVGPLVLAPALRVLAVTAGALVAGAALVEVLFGLSGLGELLVASVRARDVPVVLAVAMLAAAVVVAGLLVADLAERATRVPR